MLVGPTVCSAGILKEGNICRGFFILLGPCVCMYIVCVYLGKGRSAWKSFILALLFHLLELIRLDTKLKEYTYQNTMCYTNVWHLLK